uniref:YDG domain-containing protein n=3 Tax=Macrostomum lignano TaxID=282301 RepID=A0A1I8GDC1_9PLAT
MAFFAKEEVLSAQQFVSPETRPTIHVEPASSPKFANNCQFRALSWTPVGDKHEKLPILLQSQQPILLFRGLHRTDSGAGTEHSVNEGREAIALGFQAKGICPQLVSTLRAIEKSIEKALHQQSDRMGLIRLTKSPDASGANPITWIGIKPNYPCTTFSTNEGSRTIQEVSPRDFSERSGLYQITVQITSLYLPKGAPAWRLAACIRSLVWLSDGNTTGLIGNLQGPLSEYRIVHEHSNEEKISSLPTPSLLTATGKNRSESSTTPKKKRRTSSPPPPPSKNSKRPRPAASAPKNQPACKGGPASDPDWAEVPAVKKLVSSPTVQPGKRVASKDLSYAKQLAGAEASSNRSSDSDCSLFA